MATIYEIKIDDNIFSDGGEIPNITIRLDSSKIASIKQCEDLVRSLINIYQENFSIDNTLFEVCMNGKKEIVPFSNFDRKNNLNLNMNLSMIVNSDRRYVIPIVPAKFDGIGLSVNRAVDRVTDTLFNIKMEANKDKFPNEYRLYKNETAIDDETIDNNNFYVKFHGFKKTTDSEEIYIFRDNDGSVNIRKYAINNDCAVLSIDSTFTFTKDKKEIHIYTLE